MILERLLRLTVATIMAVSSILKRSRKGQRTKKRKRRKNRLKPRPIEAASVMDAPLSSSLMVVLKREELVDEVDIACFDEVYRKQSKAVEKCRGKGICKKMFIEASKQAAGKNIL